MARKRKRVNWGPILWLMVIANIGFGLMYSKVTSPLITRVEGALPEDEQRIREALVELNDKPALTAPIGSVLQSVYRRPDIRSASLELNLLRRGLLKVEYERKIAVLTARPNVALTMSGKLVPFMGDPALLVKLRLYSEALSPIAALSNGWETSKVADVCKRASFAELPNLLVDVSENGSVSLICGEAGKVILGSPDNLDEKFARLQQIRDSDPTLLQNGNVLVLVSPKNPSIQRIGEQP